MQLKFVIKGRPGVKKNGRPIYRNRRTGRRFLGKSETLQKQESNALADLLEQLQPLKFRSDVRFPLDFPLHVKFLFYRDTKAGVDLSNLYELTQDALQAAGIIKNDKLIESHDGSRKNLYDADNPRTEIYITPFGN